MFSFLWIYGGDKVNLGESKFVTKKNMWIEMKRVKKIINCIGNGVVPIVPFLKLICFGVFHLVIDFLLFINLVAVSISDLTPLKKYGFARTHFFVS